MLSRLRSMLSSNRVHLLDVPELVSKKPGTDAMRVSHATYRKYYDVIARFSEFLEEQGGDPNPLVTDITRNDYSAFHDWLATRGTVVITTNGYRVRARSIWHRLKKKHDLDVCNIDDITVLLREPDKQSKAITEDHFTRILQFASARDSAMILYMLDGGFRRQSVPRIKLSKTHIWQRKEDGEYRIASLIPAEKVSSAERLVMGEHRTAVAIMNWLNIRQFKDSDYIFYNMWDGEQLSAASVSEIFKDLRKRCNLPSWHNVNAHALRHKFAQDKLGDKVDAATVAAWMGITVDTLLKVYAVRDRNGLIVARFGDDDYPRELLKEGSSFNGSQE